MPSISISPSSGYTRPDIKFKKLLFPDPDCPQILINSDSNILNDTLFKIFLLPSYENEQFLNSIIGQILFLLKLFHL